MSKRSFRTDLALEDAKDENKKIKESLENGCKVSHVVLDSTSAKKYHKNEGDYYTIESDAFIRHDHDSEYVIIPEIKKILKKLFTKLKIKRSDRILVVGLGNMEVTPDALGPKVIQNLIVTNHLYETSSLDKKMGIVAALAPGVMGQTGMETFDIISSVANKFAPKVVIVVDALAARTVFRVNSIVQISTGGINPGSGVGNMRKEISKKTLGIDVIAIGVPTVVDVQSIFYDVVKDIDKEASKKYDDLNYFVTPKEIDMQINDLANIISRSLNITLHQI